MRANDYIQDRGLLQRGAVDNLSHRDFFGDCYIQALQQLGKDDTWLHVGPGNFCAEMDYFTSPRFSAHAKVISNPYCPSQSSQAVTNLEFLRGQPEFTCIDGIKFQDLRGVFLGRAKLSSTLDSCLGLVNSCIAWAATSPCTRISPTWARL